MQGTEKRHYSASRPRKDSGSGCTCGFCDGVEIERETIDPRTGVTVDRSFTVASRRTRCPNCGGVNNLYRASYTAHVADLVRRAGARREQCRFVSCTLDRATADLADVDGWDDSYRVLTGDGGVWTRGVRRMRTADPSVTYVGTLTARPSDKRAHVHAVVITSLSADSLNDCLHVAGLDVDVRAPRPTESAEQFAAGCAAYAYDNHAGAASGRFMASRGAGYHSEGAKRRRQLHAIAGAGATGDGQAGDPPGVGIETDNDQITLGDREKRREQRPKRALEGGASPMSYPKDGRAPPVECGGEGVESVQAYRQAVRRALSRRIGSFVSVNGVGAALLLRTYEAPAETGYLQCEVAVGGTDVQWVAWRRIEAVGVPLLHKRTLPNRRPTATHKVSTSDDNAMSNNSQPSPLERFNAVARTSKVTTRLPDGRRKVSVKDHETGETSVTILPPDEKWDAYL